MATAAAHKRSSPARRARPATPKKGGGRAAKAVEHKLPSGPSGIAGTVAKKAIKVIARKTLRSGARAVRVATDRAALAGRAALDSGMSRRLPIQLSIDVAVPLRVAWEEWITSGSLPEGVNRIEDVEREGDSLFGRTVGPRAADWEAEIVDEREHESFAWRSVQGSDCAGLATFHQLSERLTRIELDLDVVPTNPSQALKLAMHFAHRRAEADLRRFKAHVEFINPDAYDTERGQNGARDDSQDED